MRKTKIRKRPLRFEALEKRELLTGVISDGGTYFYHDVAAKDVLDETFKAPAGEHAKLVVSVDLGTTAFHEFAENTGRLAVSGGQYAKSLTLKNGESADLRIALKSLTDVLNGAAEHRLYATRISIHKTYVYENQKTVADVDQYYFYRFASGTPRSAAGWQSNAIPFEFDLLSRDRYVSESVRVSSPSRLPVTFAVRSAGSFEDTGGTVNRYFNYTPIQPLALGRSESGTLSILRDGKEVGTLQLRGLVVSRVKSVDAQQDVAIAEVTGPVWIASAPKTCLPIADSLRESVSTAGDHAFQLVVNLNASIAAQTTVTCKWSVRNTTAHGESAFQGTRGVVPVTLPLATGAFTLDVTFQFKDSQGGH